VVEWVPCSHVAHAYRGPRTKSVHPPSGNPYQSTIVSDSSLIHCVLHILLIISFQYKNHMRLAEVWMDEYKEYYYIRDPSISKLNFGEFLSVQELLYFKTNLT
jgi:polypeptide N-acetylgalactosaminyltransferase